jgi:hypothetical protein
MLELKAFNDQIMIYFPDKKNTEVETLMNLK